MVPDGGDVGLLARATPGAVSADGSATRCPDSSTAPTPTETSGTTVKSDGPTGAPPASGAPGPADPGVVPVAGSASSAGLVSNASATPNAGAPSSASPMPTKNDAAGSGSGQPTC